MPGGTARSAKEGIGFGLLAGVIFAGLEVLVSAAMGNPPLAPFRMFASVIIGAEALKVTPLVTAIVLGSITHLALSALFGLIYGLINAPMSRGAQTAWGTQVAFGLIFGVLLWLANFQLFGRLLYPWFLESPQPLQAVLHALFFGLPLSLMYAGSERRIRPPEEAPEAPGAGSGG